MSGVTDLEAELRELGRALGTGPPPELAGRVRGRLAGATRDPAGRGRRLGGRYAAALLAGVLLAGAVLGGTPQGRAAAARMLRLAGVEIRQGGPGPGPAASSGSGALPREEHTTLPGARRRVGFPLLVPAALGGPDDVIVSDGGRVVSLIYTRSYGAVRVDEFDGTLHRTYFDKYVADEPGAAARTTAGGRPAYWIGGRHAVVYVDRTGTERQETGRLAGPALVWQAGPVAVRLEGIADRERARAVAATFG